MRQIILRGENAALNNLARFLGINSNSNGNFYCMTVFDTVGAQLALDGRMDGGAGHGGSMSDLPSLGFALSHWVR